LDRIGAEAVQDRGSVDAADFDDFYRAEFPRLIVLARALCAPTLAQDVAQEAMLVAFRRWRSVARLERPDLWVRRVCINLAVSSFRRRVVELRAVVRLTGRSEPEPLSDDTEQLWEAVRSLPKRRAQAAALRFVNALPIADIADVLGCTEGTVEQHLSRARHTLGSTLGLAEGGDAE
jgi:RNA polymerase sigma-70 factor, ECF subfamily